MKPIDWLSLVVYLAITVWLGSRFAKRQTNADHYFTASAKIPGWAMGVSLFATLLSSVTFVAFPGYSFDGDWQVFIRELTAPIVVGLCAFLIIPIYRNVIRMSAYEYLEKRFGYPARVYGNISFLAGHFAKIGVVLYIICMAFAQITGWPIEHLLIVLGLLTIVYTFFGGIEGVIWTDVMQGLLMIGTGVLTVVYLLFFSSSHSSQEIISTAATHGKFRVVNPEFSYFTQSVWLFAWVGIFQYTTKYTTDQTVVQRYLVSKSIRETVKGTYISILCCMIAWITFMFIGTLLWSFYQLHPGRLPASVDKGDKVFPYFIGHELPAGLTGLVLAGLFAASMSTLASDLNAVGSCVVSDFYDRFFSHRSPKVRLAVSKVAVATAGVLSIALAFLISLWKKGIVEFSLNLGAWLSNGILGLFFLGFFTRRANAKGTYISLVLCAMFTVWSSLCDLYKNQPGALSWAPEWMYYRGHIWWVTGIGNLIVFGMGYMLSFLFREPLAPIELTAYRNREQDATAELNADSLPETAATTG